MGITVYDDSYFSRTAKAKLCLWNWKLDVEMGSFELHVKHGLTVLVTGHAAEHANHSISQLTHHHGRLASTIFNHRHGIRN